MKKTLIFSDIHLKSIDSDRNRQKEFSDFLRNLPTSEYDRVICLGDLFDFWFEYKYVIFSEFFDVLHSFALLRDAGIALHLVCGNHDFWAGRFLHGELGFTIHPEGCVLSFGERQALLRHGDGLNPSDRAYRAYKRFAQNRWVVGAFRLIHPDLAMMIARGVSHSSRSLLGVANPEEGAEAKALRTYAQGVLSRGEADIVLCGHAHAPVIETHPSPRGEGLYINTGDWVTHRTHVVWDGQDFHLHDARGGVQSSAGGV